MPTHLTALGIAIPPHLPLNKEMVEQHVPLAKAKYFQLRFCYLHSIIQKG